ncbi:MAG: C69 family dipeptidase [Gammaproteobacteria bacterium]|nr:C69 family dipeptidase [Gammaproteobacteria bacterium]
MCDTLVVTPEASATGTLLFAKNSDRERNEAHQVLSLPAARHGSRAKLSCTRIEIEQVKETRAVLLAKPYWIWGAEMGANDAGVVIGNEALFTRAAAGPDALLGMDLLRLALERSETATEAVGWITGLLERHGQGGLAAVHRDLRYDNGFIVADPDGAWVVETAGQQWVTRRVQGFDAISNAVRTTTEFDDASADAFREPRARGWLGSTDPDDFALAWTDAEPTARGNGPGRCRRSLELLARCHKPIRPDDLLSILRDHGDEPQWRPDDLSRPSTLCMHAALDDWRPSQTTGAMLSIVDATRSTHFLTGTSAPCLSPFRPAWIDALPAGFSPLPTARADSASLFWRHERLHRRALDRLPELLAEIADERDQADALRIATALSLRDATQAERQQAAEQMFATADAQVRSWMQRLDGLVRPQEPDPRWRAAWAEHNRRCGLVD